MNTFDIELGAIVDLAKDLVKAGHREAAGVLLKSSIEPLQKSFDVDFLADTAAAARAVAKARDIPFDTKVTQHGNEQAFIFKTGYHEVEHLRHGKDVKVTIRKTVDGPVPFKDLALAKAISIKLQRVYASMGDALLAKTEELLKAKVDEKKTRFLAERHVPGEKRKMRQVRRESPADPLAGKKPGAMLRPKSHALDRHLNKGDVVSMDPSKRRKPVEAPSADQAPATVTARLLPPEKHQEAMEHHVAHMLHHNLNQLRNERRTYKEDFPTKEAKDAVVAQAKLHENLADKHYAYALSHAKRAGRDKHDIAFLAGMTQAASMLPKEAKSEFTPHPHDSALGGRIVNPRSFDKSDFIAAIQGVDLLAKTLKRRRPPRTKRALGRHKRTQGVWAEHSRLRGKQSQQQTAARQQTRATQQGSGILGTLLGNILGS